MMNWLRVGWLTGALVLVSFASVSAQGPDLDSQLSFATLELANPESTGTAFVLSRNGRAEPARTEYLLVTAEHVFSRMKGDEATIIYHRRDGESYARHPTSLAVRRGGRPLWTRHPSADVAIMEITPPAEAIVPRVPVDLLASDATLERYEIHPGDLIRCVGFPHPNQFRPNPFGFGVTRVGCIASFPLTPTKRTRTFLIDYNAFEGDSGSPVYFSENDRVYGGRSNPGSTRLILGLVSGQHFIDEEFKMIYESGKFRHRMGMGITVHASVIQETITLLDKDRR